MASPTIDRAQCRCRDKVTNECYGRRRYIGVEVMGAMVVVVVDFVTVRRRSERTEEGGQSR